MQATLNSRERVRRSLNHQEPDRIPIDLGSTWISGIQVKAYANLKRALGIKGGEIKIVEPFQMLAEVEKSVREMLGVDTYGIQLPNTFFGYKNENWKPFPFFDDTNVLISGHAEWEILSNGDMVQFPQGDRRVPPSGKMPKNGYYFDSIIRQEPIKEEELDPKEWVDQMYSLYTEEDLRFLEEETKWYYENTNYSLIGNFGGAGFGDIAWVPGPHIKHPKGVRDPEEWYVSHITRKQYILDIFSLQYELQMKNLKMYKEAVNNRIDVIVMGGTDFGSQNGPFISPVSYREFHKPLHLSMNKWVHENTNWKTFYHTCGSIVAFLNDFSEAGMDVLNPVQISAGGMDPEFLKNNYGDKFVFWGGAINSQKTLPFDSVEEVKREAETNIKIFRRNGGFVFNNVHNIQANVPVENILALFQTAKNYEYRHKE
jgi:hypothetical protein